MSAKVIVGHVKITDDEGNILDTGVSLTDLHNTFKDMLVEMKKINIHLACVTEMQPSSCDTLED